MSVAGKITVDTEVRTAGWSKGLNDAGKEVKSFVRQQEQTFKALTFDKGFNLGGISAFGKAFSSISGQLNEFAGSIRTGQQSWRELATDVAKGIPIAGSFVSGISSIHELITGMESARAEARKARDFAIEMAREQERLGFSARKRGTYGDERQHIEIDQNAAEQRNKIEDDIRAAQDAQKTLLRRTGRQLTGDLTWRAARPEDMTAAMRAEYERQQKIIETGQDKLADLDANTQQTHADTFRDAAERQRQFMRQEQEASAAFTASAQEKSLRRQGQALQSAIVGVNADAAAKVRAEQDKITDYALAGLSDEDRTARIQAVNDTIKKIQADAATTIGDLQREDARRQQEIAIANQDRLKEIQSRGSIDRLKIEDEAINAANEKRGIAARSHQAEAAEIQAAYDKEVADIAKRYREEHRTGSVNMNDPTVKAQMQAADEERRQKLGLLTQHSTIEATRNADALGQALRKAWESAGQPADQYRAKLADIQAEYAKFHDARLRDAQIGKLDQTTFEELKRQHPDHNPQVNLYGRTLSYAHIPTSNSSQLAAQQLAEIKAQNQRQGTWDQWFKTIYDYFNRQAQSASQDLNI